MSELDSWSTEKLLTLALNADDDLSWRAIAALHRRGTRDIFERSHALCQSADPNARDVGVSVLGQLGWNEQYPFREETLPMLLHLLTTEQNIEVLHPTTAALGHLHDDRAIEPLIALCDHSDPLVRYGVVFGLLGYERQPAVDALITLSRDSDELVRDWATFGLGALINADTALIREALYARIDDPDETTCGEALVGLARRQDQRVLVPLRHTLEEMPEWVLPLEAAEALADPRLLAALLHFQAHWTYERGYI